MQRLNYSTAELQGKEYSVCGSRTAELKVTAYSLCGRGTVELKVIEYSVCGSGTSIALDSACGISLAPQWPE